VTIAELVERMVELQVQIPALPTIINAQVAGVIATGSHVSIGIILNYTIHISNQLQ
jgi:hypothetical protein